MDEVLKERLEQLNGAEKYALTKFITLGIVPAMPMVARFMKAGILVFVGQYEPAPGVKENWNPPRRKGN